jgi:hypothetical protein
MQHKNKCSQKRKTMSFLTVALPFTAVLPAAEVVAGTVAGAARPLLGLGAAAAFAIVFKPLLTGMLRAALLTIRPRESLEARNQRNRFLGARLLQRMARDVDESQPGLAAEFRWLASRG